MQPPSHNSHSIVDATKLKAYIECPRAYFYEYVLGWRSETPSIHLEFGKAWHLAMEHLLLTDYTPANVSKAWTLLSDYYRKFFPPEMDETLAPKNPGFALNALMAYAKEYQHELPTQRVLYTEIGGTVAMDDTHVIHFRMDSILENIADGMIRSREHKTGSTLNRQWTDQWSLAVQTWVYNHVLYSLFPKEKVWGVEINGTFFQKKETKFLRVPARRQLGMMEVGYWNTLSWLLDLEYDMERLQTCTDADPILFCFPQKPDHCTAYFGCKYLDFCIAWPNPLRRIDEVPLGMKIDFWDPRDEETKVNFNVEGRL
jgi:hypothetical protein